MNELFLTLAWSAPLLLLAFTRSRFVVALMPLAALPAMLAAVTVPVGTAADIPWLLLGLTLHLDPIGATFLLFSSVMWLFAGLYASLTMAKDTRLGRFGVFFLLASAGNLLLIVAADIVTFYVGFALMGLAATGLIAHRRSQHAERAARVYLAWTLVGEMALFAAVVLLANDMASLRFADLTAAALPDAAAILLLFGFGIKLALPGLHVWLPLAYPAAPAAATAVLSGPMISAGLLGWLRFLPPGNPTLAGWGEGLLALGVVGTALGVLAGLVQRDPRTLLAYSSVAKMGLVTSVFGVALIRPDAAPGIVAALVVFTMHHLMLKGTLFLGIGEWQRLGGRLWLTVVLGILALALIGAPFTSGAGVKLLLTDATIGAGFDLALLFGFSTLGTLFLMARFIWFIRQRPSTAEAGLNPASLVWLALAALAILLPLTQTPLPWSSSGLGTIAAGLGITAAFVFSRRWVPFTLPTVPPGDLLYLVRAAQRLWTGGARRQQHFTLSPRALMSADTCRTAARTLGALVWLFVCVFVLAIGLLPG
jgi:formate hydrogenlyase subunit 3/multisubunit Na+/H+ antiporter MnhD subunit